MDEEKAEVVRTIFRKRASGISTYIEVGFSVVPGWQGRGLATEALKKVLDYLTGNEGISCVTAWCAAENNGSKMVLEKAGMKLVRTEKDAIMVGNRVYDKFIYEYRRQA